MAVVNVPLCPEADLRAAMTDEEFWDHVLSAFQPACPDVDDDYDERDLTPFGTLTPCPVCGEFGACAYDSEGRPMLHTSTEDEE